MSLTFRENQLQNKVIEYLEKEKIYYINIFGSGFTAKGAPDLICCINGMFVALELKVGKNDLSNAQKIHKIRIKRNDGIHYSPRSLKEVIEIVENIRGVENK